MTTSPTEVQTYLPDPSTPTLRLPPLACDTHVHVFGPRPKFPYAGGLKVTPQDAPKEKLYALHKRLGIERCVIVQSAVHGHDNSVVQDAIEHGEGRYLGIALVQPDVADAELERLARAGFRGVRFNFMSHLVGVDIDDVIALTPRLAGHGLHLQVHFESKLVHELGPKLKQSHVPVVIDHMGRVDARLGAQHEDFQALMRLLDTDRFWVKVSGIDRIDANAPPEERYRAGEALARTLVDRFPDQVLWGSDWPHPNHTHIPDDGALVDALSIIAADAVVLHKLLVQNPQSLYRFTTD
ncbi:amidohydrolase [Bordetella sp. 15P40C-2]|uniref:amidohydrolase family protein n=1 Tax=Bordetella sp. 15P40C-2 TaxID=2572246 RepID=UPI0013285C52|nr:amidohydrolase family protein [Bordetella sp. 15P40C-2]MVW72825.1 amidohydrolase family protein [Bordetella sp. 15P40C-2]